MTARGKKRSSGMSDVAQQLYDLASRPLTFESCSKADRIAESISDKKKRHRAYDFVQKYMWDRLPEKSLPKTQKTVTRHAKPKSMPTATKRVSLIDDFGDAYGEYLQDPKPINLAKAQSMYIRAKEGGETSRDLYQWAQEIGDRVLMESWTEERGNYWQPSDR